MLLLSVRKFGTMVLLSIFFFYLGCYLTLSITRIDCSTETPNSIALNQNEIDFETAEYIVLIISSPSNEAKRDTIRATWANFVNNIFIENGEIVYKWNHTWTLKNFRHTIIKIYFVMGTLGLNQEMYDKINNEQKRSKDMLLLDNVEDKYENLSIKMLHSMNWLSKNLKLMKYVIKCDDDSFVRIDLIVKDLDAFAPSMNAPELSSFVTMKNDLQSSIKGLYWGYFHGNAKVYLNGKWAETEWFLCDNYLPYALGGGYVISRSIVDYIAKNIDFLSHYNSEDVSMGVWTGSLKAINRVHDIRFDTEWKSRGCDETMLVRHKQTTSDMFLMYKTLVYSHGAKLCKTEDFKRKTYLYDWNVLPSKCCRRS